MVNVVNVVMKVRIWRDTRIVIGGQRARAISLKMGDEVELMEHRAQSGLCKIRLDDGSIVQTDVRNTTHKIWNGKYFF